MGAKPRIGISADVEPREVRGVHIPFAQISQWYWNAVVQAGGVPFILPPLSPDDAPAVMEMLDGLVVSGGDFDIDPAFYGADKHPKLGRLEPRRTHFELALIKHCEAAAIPVLGVCGGMQVMNVYRGGTLFQDLPSEQPSEVPHSQEGAKGEPSHTISVHKGGVLERLIGLEPLAVNSTHHQAVRNPGRGFRVDAVAEDGVIEAISDPTLGFFLGVQWHPEAMNDFGRHGRIYGGLVAAAARTR